MFFGITEIDYELEYLDVNNSQTEIINKIKLK
jgi:hypothetical protein